MWVQLQRPAESSLTVTNQPDVVNDTAKTEPWRTSELNRGEHQNQPPEQACLVLFKMTLLLLLHSFKLLLAEPTVVPPHCSHCTVGGDSRPKAPPPPAPPAGTAQ